ncbi:hypothetical protein CPB83DRAFT_879289 [Crepidotus variabilis]|uniref:Crinkler effector protein N-terminal domain-containing protein n=1 Tax=Crepidotus variabilis TaxID=179855 RepID=A0A9P6EUH4_9AGAR|nr:hypothetical protein CPB83DRAFT_879289 [Crepidotus variabilis]
MSKLTLNCVFFGETEENIFSVEVSAEDSVNTLKILIKDLNALLNVPIRKIQLYQVSFPWAQILKSQSRSVDALKSRDIRPANPQMAIATRSGEDASAPSSVGYGDNIFIDEQPTLLQVDEELVPDVGQLFSVATDLYKSEFLRQARTNPLLGRLLGISYGHNQAQTTTSIKTPQSDAARISEVAGIFVQTEYSLELGIGGDALLLAARTDINCILPQPIYNDDGLFQPLTFTGRFTFVNWTPRDNRRSLFRTQYGDDQTIVKFCSTYSTHAHQILSDAGFAPKLFYDTRLRGGIWMIVMEYISTTNLADQLTPSAKLPDGLRMRIRKIIQLLHDNNVVFGDLRRPNVLMKIQEPLLIDFDWAGEHSNDRYPPQMNMVDIQWPNGVGPNAIMDKAHDLQMLEWL